MPFHIPLGARVRDALSGFEGIAYGRIEYVTGCTQYQVVPPVDKDGKRRDAEWFDEARLEITARPIALPGASAPVAPAPAGPSLERMPSEGLR